MVGGRLRGHGFIPVSTHAGGATVDATPRGDLPRGVPRGLHALHPVGCRNRFCGGFGQAYDICDHQSAAVQDDDRAAVAA